MRAIEQVASRQSENRDGKHFFRMENTLGLQDAIFRLDFLLDCSMGTFLLLLFAIPAAAYFGIAVGRARSARTRQLWLGLKAGRPDAIAIVILVAAYTLYVMLSYESPTP